MNNGALIDRVVRIDHLRGGEAEERIDRNEDDADGIIMNGAPPLEVMICSDEERGSNVSFPKRGEGTIIGLMNKR